MQKALRQSERLKSALLDAVAHDLRTPLTSIKSSITTLLDEV
jgi:two-component system sensor histidine kinase KdpD